MPKEVDASKFRQVVCPYFPPMISPPKLQGQPPAINYGMCIGENCALFDQCQGELSPRANAVRMKNLVNGLSHLVKLLPVTKEVTDAFEWVKVNLEMALKPNSNAPKDA